MELLGDFVLMESHLFLFVDSVSVGARYVHSLCETYHWLKNRFGHNQWYFYVMRLK
jgi:hypothetical protein